MKRILLMAVATSVLVLGASGPAYSDEKAEPPYGHNLMTQEEWREHDEAMTQLSAEERHEYRQRIHAEMKERARERGIELPDEVPDWAGTGMGPGHGMGPGQGMGPGHGMGPGKGTGSGPGRGGGAY